MKTCSKCKIEKPFSEFPKDKRRNDGLKSNCKACSYESTIKWNRSPMGVVCHLWHKHNERSNKRRHEKPDYSREWLYDFVLNHPEFDRLYTAWVESDYDKMMAPSVDRIDDRVGYTKNNIRLVTFRENLEHCWVASRSKDLDNPGWENGLMGSHRAVRQYDLDGRFIREYISIQEACRETGSSDSKVSAVCKGKRMTHNLSQWRYADDDRPVAAVNRKRLRSNGKATNVQKVKVTTVNGDFVGFYDSVAAACRGLNINYRSAKRARLSNSPSNGYFITNDQANETAI